MKNRMVSFFNNIRKPENNSSVWKKVTYSVCIMVFGILLGVVSKYLDCTPVNTLPNILQSLDIRNFLGRFSIWIFIAVCISIYSKSPFRAAVNVFVFFTGMVSSYYLYSKFIAGFFPRSYAMIWIGFTMISPFLAWICWYAKGNGKIALTISAGITAVLFNTTFVYSLRYFDVPYIPEFIVFLLTLFVLRRTVKETMIMIAAGVIIAVILNYISPIQFW